MNRFFSRGALLSSLLFGLPLGAEPITVVLKLKGKFTMKQLAANVSNPLSDHFNIPYEPAEIRQLAGPSDSDYAELLSGLKAEGMSIVSESPTHLWVSVRGEKAIYESLFSTSIQAVSPGVHQMVKPMSIPVHLNLVETVSGLNSIRKSHPKYHIRTIARDNGDGGGGPDSGIPQATIKAAYGLSDLYASGVLGNNIDVAVATYGGFMVDDVNTFYAQSGLSPAPVVDQVNFNGTAAYDENSAVETQLDAEFIGMIAPGSHIHVFPSATNDDAGEVAVFTAILDDNRAKLVNYSWGGCETGLDPDHQTAMQAVFDRAIAQGVNIFVASGDSGAYSCGDSNVVADWPGAHPEVTAVGGTHFSQDDSGALNESAWTCTDPTSCTDPNVGTGGSGGGISTLFGRPTYQSGLPAVFGKRSYPDVAFNADPQSGQAMYAHSNGTATWIVIGGTSMASPQWVGFMALIAESRQSAGKPALGFLNPILYKMSQSDRAITFHDITVGGNGGYTCSPGFDAVTGLGSMNASALATYLNQ